LQQRDSQSAAFSQRGTSTRLRSIRTVLIAIFAFNLMVGIAKLGYGLISNSVGMSADGVNSLMDGVSNVVELIGVSVAARPPDENHPYGHRRYETLTSLGIVLFMALALQEILQRTWDHWQHGIQPEVNTGSFIVMLGTTAALVGATLWTRQRGRALSSSVLRAESHHLAGDVAVSLSVIAGLVAVRLGFPQADLVIALIVAVVIAWAAWTIIRHSALTLTDATAASTEEIDRAARSVPGVRGVHNIRTRGGEGAIWTDLHIQVDPKLPVDEAHTIASRVAERVEEELARPTDVTVHVEPASAEHLRPERGYSPGEGSNL
jgi:cation diffusion facilitator family transporter